MGRKTFLAALAATLVMAVPAAAQESSGVIDVPLDHAQPGGPKLKLAYTHFKLPAATRRGTIVFLAGGPGEPAVRDADEIASLLGALRETYEVVVFDQRGTGRSSPLRCPSLRRLEAETNAGVQAIRACGERLGEARSHYSTYETALDLEDLRARLGRDRIIPLGTSYGGQVAGEYARRFPGHLQALILDSTSPLEGIDVMGRLPSEALTRVLDEICFTPRCENSLGDPKVMLDRTLELLAFRTPPRLTITDVYEMVRASDADLLVRSELPAALQGATQGDEAALVRLRRYLAAGETEGGINPARFLATTCMEGGLPWAPDAADRQTRNDALVDRLFATKDAYAPFPITTIAAAIPATLCVEWPATPRPPSAAGQPGPDVPVLLLAGREDLRTPLEDQRRTAAQYPNAQVLSVPGVGHSVLGSDTSGCAARGLRDFLAGRRVPTCKPSGRRPLDAALPLFRSLRAVPRPRGDAPAVIGRTAVAVDITLRDAARWSLVEAAGLRSVPGLRGGRMVLRRNTARLIRYEVVPGVRVSGTLGRGRDTVVVTGSGATGTLRIDDRTLRGVLDGRRITYRPYDPTPVGS